MKIDRSVDKANSKIFQFKFANFFISVISTLVLIYFGRSPLRHTIKTKYLTFQTVDPEIFCVLVFLEKGLGLPSPPHFMYDFSRKLFLMLYSFN